MKHKIIKSLTCVKSLGRVYTGGHACWSGGQIFSLVDGALNIVEGGQVKSVVEEEEDPILCFTVGPGEASTSTTLVTSHKSGLVRIWSSDRSTDCGPSLVRTFRSIHSGTVNLLRLQRVGESTVLATGGSDGSVKVWDLTSQYYTHNLRSPHTVVTVLTFHPTQLLLYVGHASGALSCWDLSQSKLLHNMEAHLSAVTALSISPDTNRAVSAGRDSVCVVWDLTTHTKLSTIPVFSPVEGLVMLEGSHRVMLALEDRLCVWRLEGGSGQRSELRVGSSVTSLTGGEDKVHITTSDRNLVTCEGGRGRDVLGGHRGGGQRPGPQPHPAGRESLGRGLQLPGCETLRPADLAVFSVCRPHRHRAVSGGEGRDVAQLQ